MSKQVTLIDPSVGKATKTGLALKENLSFDQWQQLGETLRYVEGSVLWWIGDWLNYGERKFGEMYTQALEETDYSYQTLADAKWVASKIEFSRRREKLPFSTHREVAVLERDQQEEILSLAEQEGAGRKEVRALVRDIKRGIGNAPMLPPAGKYSVIYADPPWSYEHPISDSRRIENQYPTMELDEICALPVSDLAADDAMLFLWATSPLLEKAFAVINAWGFDYRTCMVWVKDRIGMGYYVRQQHELLLIARRGDPVIPDTDDKPPSVIKAPRGKHSEKPVEAYEVIERMYPGVPRIELFCRSPREGWAVWGNQVAAA